MAFKILLKKFKAFKAKRRGKMAIRNKAEIQKIWTGVSHGFHAVEGDSISASSVHAQREQIEGLEVWLFGVHDHHMACGVTNYLQSHLFDNNPTEHQIRRKAKETMKKAYYSAKADDIRGSASMLVMDGEIFVAASVGGYRAVLCTDGVATQLGAKHQRKQNRKWAVSDIWNMNCASIKDGDNPRKSSRFMITAQQVETDTELVILASDGVWEVMRNQEAVDLVSHIEDAQKAAECLAEEALNRMSKSAISCVVVRFH